MVRRGLWLAFGLLAVSTAHADSFPSVVGGTTVAPHENVLEFGLGHSDVLSVGWRRGVAPALELGVVASGTFGYRGLLFAGGGDVSGSALGARLLGRLKVRLLEAGMISLGLSFQPGLSYSSWVIGTLEHNPRVGALGLELPVDLKLGLALSDRTTLGLRVEVPMFLEFWSRDGGALRLQPLSSFAWGPRVGLGVEHAVSQAVLLFLQVSVGLVNVLTLEGEIGLAWRLPVV